ncbi:MAG: hypothetical protein KME25_21255 [Symplocastrum torsivum CPER-KK1]|uniref:Uncharacterized protein n=1 Tax=Symplocastrum torsivum CPER-KK1 TaxID=450513 RepID=A0A951UCS6_9CYAN|nr:hypothetical protein [Symplocastrum torsivum CPER-KK1]
MQAFFPSTLEPPIFCLLALLGDAATQTGTRLRGFKPSQNVESAQADLECNSPRIEPKISTLNEVGWGVLIQIPPELVLAQRYR